MNASYRYKNNRNNLYFNPASSKKGSCRPFVRRQSACVEFADRCLAFIDTVLDFFCSARFLIRAKATFAFVALVGLLGIIGGMEFGTVSLLSGTVCLALVIALEFLVIKDETNY